MKQLLAVLCLLFFENCQAFDSIGLVGLPIFSGAHQAPSLYYSFGPTLAWYRPGKTTLLDVGSNKDLLTNTRSKTVPGFYVDLGRYWKETQVLNRSVTVTYGLRTSYARRNKAIKNDYLEPGSVQAEFSAEQDVKDLRVTPFVGVQRTQNRRFCYGAHVGFGIGVKTLDNFKLYEKATGSYTGQRLQSGSMSFLGEFAAHMSFEHRGYYCTFGYTFTTGRAKYKRRVFIDQPGSAASVTFQDQVLLTDREFIFLPKEPRIRLRSHRLELSIGKDF